MIILNAEIYREDGGFQPGAVCTDGALIADRSTDGAVVDGTGCYLLPGLVDIHLHGCAGADFCGCASDGGVLRRIARYEASRGVTTVLPATMSLPREALLKVCRYTAAYPSLTDPLGAEIAGIYMECPFLAPAKAGAQDAEALRLPDASFFYAANAAAGGLIRFLALAPELEGAESCIRELCGLTAVSLAHTGADYETARRAFACGASQVTHLYNAMSGMSHRAPGVAGAAADTPGIRAELICDGVHVHPAVVRQTFKMFGAERIIFISDSMEAAGMPDGTYTLGGQRVRKTGRRAVLAGAGENEPAGTEETGPAGTENEVLAGSVSTLTDCLRTAVLDMRIPLADAVRCAAVNPAIAAGIYDRCGSISVGKKADLVLLDRQDLQVRSVILRGRLIGPPQT